MKRQNRFSSAEDIRLDRKIEETMAREFRLPERVEAAKQSAFAGIRSGGAVQGRFRDPENKSGSAAKKRTAFVRTATGLSAAAASLGLICAGISNPAIAAQIPLVGHVFETLGSSLDFSGNYSQYAVPLTEETGDASGKKQEEGEAQDETVKSGAEAYSQTVDGVTVTLSEIYCSDAALYLSLLIETEEAFPDTLISQDGKPAISLWNSALTTSFNPEAQIISDHLDGRMIDSNTYAGVLRIDLERVKYSFDDTYYDAQDTFFESLGVTEEELEADPHAAYDKVEELLGTELLSADVIAAAGGPDYEAYRTVYEVPDEFTLNLQISSIVGILPESGEPEMPQELLDEYHAAMAENGLDEADYKNFTEEEKEIELQLFNEMHNKYAELYPEVNQYPNSYNNWWYDGEWEFEVPVVKNDDDTIVKEIQDTDENGLGIAAVTKTPMEITVDSVYPAPAYDYFTVVLDADGEPLDSGYGTDAWEIGDNDVSKLDIYICDYIEYMDELKGYYWSDTYEEDQKTKTFRQLLDERALYHTEVIF